MADENKLPVKEEKKTKKTVKNVKKTEQKTAVQPKENKPTRRLTTKNEWDVLSHSLMTEKSIGLIEKENKLVFIVNLKATKPEIKGAVEKAFDVSVDSVTTSITRKGQKKAFVKISQGHSASEIATRLGML
ncbi:MAG: 50S ribosomal protein L23 [Candidatus Aenigmarchaeota archaeon]|nr:50S ribosomal protein L23 [Candidatus Aenigmarchaeota archaeon]